MTSGRVSTALVLPACLLAGLASAGRPMRASQSAAPGTVIYRPALPVPETLAPFLAHLEPGTDDFRDERVVAELDARLRELGEGLREGPAGASRVTARLLASGFRGARLADDVPAAGQGPLQVSRSASLPAAPDLDAGAFGRALQRLVGDMRAVTVAEFLITSIDTAAPLVKTDVRYDLVGEGPGGGRVQHVGVWRMTWRQEASGWQVVSWVAASHVASRTTRPVFAEITAAALAGNAALTRQLGTGLDDWMATFDSVLTRDSNGHHGVSVGDADGDGLDDLYVAQPAGLPNRLLRARGDSTFEDITERAGLAVLDDTAQSLFADVDNDGDQDLVLATGTRLLLFVNDGAARFQPVPDAFRFARPPQGVLTSIAMADYDRDGFLDLYLCVYSYFFGAGEDKAGTPMPYYDARNGPPGVLLRNDGRGRFVDATEESGIDAGNDRYHFAAAWADYDRDGWPDLLVANDFGTKNLYRNRGRQNGTVTFEDVAGAAGVLDHGAGMSAAFLDYDNDGRLDIYTGNMWSANGLRVTASQAFMPEAPAGVRALYRRHARGNSLFRNRGDGRFDDTTLEAGAEMGRWAWSSDAVDFDSDGWEDLYVVNGMLSRAAGPEDLDGFFWRQVVARSPLTRVKGAPYDDAWRAINQQLIHRSIASRQRNVALRNNGRGGFDDVSGSLGLDLDQDGRSFAVLDVDRDGDPDLAVMAARQAPQLRLFRNDFGGAPGGAPEGPRHASIAIRLVGRQSNRDAIGARVVVERGELRRTKIVQAGSGFLSQHSKQLIVGLGPGRQPVRLTVEWPAGSTQVFTGVAPGTRLRLVEGGELEAAPFAAAPVPAATAAAAPAGPPEATWLFEPFPAPEFQLPAPGAGTPPDGSARSLQDLRGRPAVLLLWSAEAGASRAALDALAQGRGALARAGIGALAMEIGTAPGAAEGAGGARGAPVPREVADSFAILSRHLFMNRQDLRLPSAMLLDAAGRVVKVYRGRLDIAGVAADAARLEAPPAERLARAIPFPGVLYSPVPPRNYLPYGRELLDQGLDAPALSAFERAAEASPTAFTLYRLGTLLARRGETARARAAFERALSQQPDLAEANNDLGALLAQAGDLDGAIGRFRAALAAAPDYPDALNNLGYALLLAGRGDEARPLYEKALALQPDFPEALNNLGLLVGRAGELDRAEAYFREAVRRRAEYGEAVNNLALVLVARSRADDAVRMLDEFQGRVPGYEGTYITLAKIHLAAGRTAQGLAVLERLLQRNPTHPVAVELVREWKPR